MLCYKKKSLLFIVRVPIPTRRWFSWLPIRFPTRRLEPEIELVHQWKTVILHDLSRDCYWFWSTNSNGLIRLTCVIDCLKLRCIRYSVIHILTENKMTSFITIDYLSLIVQFRNLFGQWERSLITTWRRRW